MVRFCLFLLLFSLSSYSAFALEIKAVRANADSDKNRFVLELDQVSDFSAFAAGNPYQILIDLPQFNWKAKPLKNPIQTGIKGLRHGDLKSGISRVALDLKNPIVIRNAFTLSNPPRVVIDFIPASESLFQQNAGKIYGLFNGNAPPSPQYPLTTPEDNKQPSPPSVPTEESVVKKPLIIIDPGHGGVDPGALGPDNLREKNVVLKLAKELKNQLLSSGHYRVEMTREDDIFIRLHDRVKFARKKSGDLFVSIHADSIDSADTRGASVYTLSEKASDEQTAKLAAKENQADLIAGVDLSIEDKDVVNILVDLAMRDTMNQSKFFADKLVKAMSGDGVKTLENAHRYAGFAVLKAPDIPSILVEVGFMSNDKEARQLNTAEYRKKVVKSLKRGIDAYFEQVRKNERI